MRSRRISLLISCPGLDEHLGDGRQAARLGDRQGRLPVVGPGVDVGALLDQQEDEVAPALGAATMSGVI